jgi:hypothetical protein
MTHTPEKFPRTKLGVDKCLIDAAPELLAACERCEQYLIVAAMDCKDNERLLAHVKRDLEMLRAAIAKAEGDK